MTSGLDLVPFFWTGQLCDEAPSLEPSRLFEEKWQASPLSVGIRFERLRTGPYECHN